MPYIRPLERKSLDNHIFELSTAIEHDGMLNYTITKLCHNWIIKTGHRYTRINQVMGVLSCAALEFYRQIANDYEDKKKLENGDISILDTKV